MEWLIMYQVLCVLFLLNLSHITCSQFYSSLTSSVAPSCPSDQSFALLQFKSGFTFDRSASYLCDGNGVPSYPKMMSWKEGSDCCSWDGVTCDGVIGHVIGLDLSCSWLLGSIYSNSSLFLLPHLQSLNFANNDFSFSQISSMFGRFTNLTHLNLSGSQFSGQISAEISHLSKLISLDLSLNSLLTLEPHSFKLLLQNLTQVQELLLDTIDMPSIVSGSFMNLSSSLKYFSLSYCQLQCKLPDKFFHLPNLQMLDLSHNFGLTGHLPESNWSSPLKFIDLSWTSFSGEFPYSIGNLKSLKHLDLSHCNFTGSIPAWVGNMTQLTELDLKFNNFSGQIPDVFGNIKNLASLSLQWNNFGGQLPSSILNLTQLVSIDMSHNQLVDPNPYEVSRLSNLYELYLYENLLNGTIPSWLFNLPLLVILELGNNQLTGYINEFQYNSLEYIDLSNNKLHGLLPGSVFELVNLTQLFLSSNNLSGIVDLDMFSKLKNLSVLDLSFNSLSLSTNSNINSNWPLLIALQLSSCNITEFPDFLRTQKKLRSLDLSSNKIHGQIPKWVLNVGKDSLYYLNLSHNFLTGIKQLQSWNLKYLDLHSNLLQGSLPSPPDSVRFFYISNNMLTGAIPLSICNMSFLQVLVLSNNSLSGIIPQCLWNVSDYLSVLDLRMNSFHGTIPQTFSRCKSLRNLGLNGNRFEGSLPQSLTNCEKLEVLDLGNNKISGTFPHWLETLPELQVLLLRSNRFHGSLLDSKAKQPFPKLRILDLSDNNFSGPLPKKYFKNFKAMMNVYEEKSGPKYMGHEYYRDYVTLTMKGLEIELQSILTIFTTIDLSKNRLQGQIPTAVGNLNSLLVLNFSHNSLTGHIPSSLGNLTALESLDLSSNKLTGEIPLELTSLTFLEVLNLSQNQLMGKIPHGKQFDTFENNSYSGNLGLCGSPLSKKCSYNEALQPPSSALQKEPGNDFSWKIILMGYGCGIVIGLAIGSLVFSTGKPRWYVKMVEGEERKLVRMLNHIRRGRRN